MQTSPPPFTGRAGPQAVADEAWASLTPQDPRVLVFHGIGGIGKSRLLRELRATFADAHPDAPHGLLDFADRDVHTPAKALERLRIRYHDGFGVRFPSFDVAFAIYWCLANPGVAHTFDGEGFFDEGEATGAIALTLLSIARETPGVAPFVRIPRLIRQGTNAAQRWWTERGEAELQALRTLDQPLDVARHLPAIFAADLKAWSAGAPDRRLALYADTLDDLDAGALPRTAGRHTSDWFADFVSHLRGVLVVAAARTPPPWAIPPATTVLVEALTPDEADQLLRDGGLTDPDLRRALAGSGDVHGRSRGVPLYLALALDAYREALDTTGAPPAAEAFTVDIQGLLDLVLSYADDGVREAVYTLSVPGSFDRALFGDLMRQFPAGVAPTSAGLARVTRYSFVTEREPGRFAVHDLVRDAVALLSSTEDQRDVMGFLLLRARDAVEAVEHLAITDAERQALLDWIELSARAFPTEGFLDNYWAAEEPFYAAGDWSFLLPIRKEVAAFAERELGSEHPATLTALHNVSHVASELGQAERARELYQAVYDARAAHPELGPDHTDTLSALNGLASTYADFEDFETAADLHRRVLEARERTLPEDHPHIATSLNNLGHALKVLGQFSKAETYYRRALRWRREHLRPGHPETLTSINNLASLLVAQGNRPGAGRLLREAHALATEHLPEDHPVRLGAQNSLGAWYLGSPDPKAPERALPLLAAALEGRRRTLGEAHPQTLRAASNHAAAEMKAGRPSDAERSLMTALRLARESYGPDHSLTQHIELNLAAARQMISDDSDCELM